MTCFCLFRSRDEVESKSFAIIKISPFLQSRFFAHLESGVDRVLTDTWQGVSPASNNMQFLR